MLRVAPVSRRRSGGGIGGALWHVHSAALSFVYCASCLPRDSNEAGAAQSGAPAMTAMATPVAAVAGVQGASGGHTSKEGGDAPPSVDGGGGEWQVGGGKEIQLPTIASAERALLMSELRPASSELPASALARACDAACRACAEGGNVLVPCTFHGATLSFIESLARG